MAEEDDFDWDNDDFDPDSGFVNKTDQWQEEDKDLEILEEPTRTTDDQSDVPKMSKQERIEEKKAKRRAEELKKLALEGSSTTNELTEKLRLQKIQEDADLEVAKELFGVVAGGIDKMAPKTKDDFDTFKELLTKKLQTLELSTMYVSFLDDLLRDITLSLDVEDIRRLSNTLSHIANEKQKAIKGTKTKKKGGAKLALGKAAKRVVDTFDNDMGGDLGGEFDDFM